MRKGNIHCKLIQFSQLTYIHIHKVDGKIIQPRNVYVINLLIEILLVSICFY